MTGLIELSVPDNGLTRVAGEAPRDWPQRARTLSLCAASHDIPRELLDEGPSAADVEAAGHGDGLALAAHADQRQIRIGGQRRVPLTKPIDVFARVVQVGRSYDDPRPLHFDELDDPPRDTAAYNGVDDYCGFRVVLKAQ